MPSSFHDTIARHVDAVFTHGGTKDSPLLADTLTLPDLAHARWQGLVLTNLACQQNFLRALDAFGTLTGDASYHDRADAWIAAALPRLHEPQSDLLYWGGHTSYDLLADEPVIGNHEMKCVYPHYPYLFGVDAAAMERFVEAAWHAHIWNWETLLFNRHGIYEPWERGWDVEFKGGPLPLVEQVPLSFINTGSDLILAAGMLHAHVGHETALRWAFHLLSRYDQVRHSDTGLAGYQFNHRSPCRVRESFKPPFSEREDLNETTVVSSNVIPTRYGRAALTFANLAEALGDEQGKPLLDFIARDLTALAEHSWDERTGCFIPCINDGTRLAPDNAVEGVGYCPPSKLQPVRAEGVLFASYARAFRLTGIDRFHDMAVRLARGMGWTSVSAPSALPSGLPERRGWINAGQDVVASVFGLLDLHDATGDAALLSAAETLATDAVARYTVNGLLVSDGVTGESNADSALPLALCHLEAARQGTREGLPAFYPNNTYFDPKIVLRRWEQEGR